MVLAGRIFRTLVPAVLLCLSGQTIAKINAEILHFFAQPRIYFSQDNSRRLTIEIHRHKGNFRLVLHLLHASSSSGTFLTEHHENILVNAHGHILSGEITESGKTYQFVTAEHDQVAAAGQIHIPVETFHPLALALALSQGSSESSTSPGTNLLDSFAEQPAVFQSGTTMQPFGTGRSSGATLTLSCSTSGQQSVSSSPGHRRDYVFSTANSPGHNRYTVKSTHQSRGCCVDCSSNHAVQVLTSRTVGGQTFVLQEDFNSYNSAFWLALMFFAIAAQALGGK